jgi:hypothetical protein
MVDVANGNPIFIEHLMVDFHGAQSNQTKVVAKL